MKRSGWSSALDVSVVACVLALLTIVSGVLASYGISRPYLVLFGIVDAFATFWLLLRIWWLIRVDEGPSTLLLFSVAAGVVTWIYSESWNALIVGHAFQQWTDMVAITVRVAGLAFLAIALGHWDRIPRWVSWTFGAYAAVVAIASFAASSEDFAEPSPTAALWAACLLALAIALFGAERLQRRPSAPR